MNWQDRISNKGFWLTLIPAVLLLVQVCAAPFGYEWDFVVLNQQLAAIVNALFSVLVILGVVTDPTTPGITDKGYITNSYHVHVTEKIDAFDKLKFESAFQRLSPGGAISYVEVPNMQDNLKAVIRVMQYIYDNIMYAELNTKSDYCQVCGWDGEIEVVEEDGKLIWKCPQCGNTDQDKMNVARRTCGYIGTQFWNQGRTQEIKDRVLHL